MKKVALKWLYLLVNFTQIKMSEEKIDYKLQFKFLQPIFKQKIRGKDVDFLAKEIGVGKGSLYNYLAGKVPEISVCKNLIEQAIKLLESKGEKIETILSNQTI